MITDFGYKHLTGLAWLFSLIAITLVILLVIRKKFNKGESYDRAVVRYICYFMWAWEIIKTVRMINYPDYGPVGYYPLWMAPFHICSMALYAYLIIGSKKDSKLQEWVKPFGFATMIIVTMIILIIPASSGIMGNVNNWSFCFDNILPYQSFMYHGCLVLVPLYMAISGFYKPKWSDIYKAGTVLLVCAAFAYGLNYLFEGSGADYMMLRYGNGNPFVGILQTNPGLYYILMGVVGIGGTSVVLSITILIRKLVCRKTTTETTTTTDVAFETITKSNNEIELKLDETVKITISKTTKSTTSKRKTTKEAVK